MVSSIVLRKRSCICRRICRETWRIVYCHWEHEYPSRFRVDAGQIFSSMPWDFLLWCHRRLYVKRRCDLSWTSSCESVSGLGFKRCSLLSKKYGDQHEMSHRGVLYYMLSPGILSDLVAYWPVFIYISFGNQWEFSSFAVVAYSVMSALESDRLT